MDPSKFNGNHKGSQEDDPVADGYGADGPDSEDCTDFSSGMSSDSSSSYAPSDSEVICNDLHDNGNPEDNASSAAETNPSNDRKPTTATARSFSFTGNEHLVVQPVPSEADGMIAPIDVYK
ncbi:hypothetical protein SK128_010685, partial [Halocaridina rubra]